MSEPPFDVEQAHRWFAVEFNNRAWDLVEANSRTADEVEEMIHTSHAACAHWMHAGDALSRLRAECLVATAYVKAELAEPAVRHAAKSLALSAEVGASQTTFDRACVHGCAAAAFRLNGGADAAREQFDALDAAIGELYSDDEIQLVDALYRSK